MLKRYRAYDEATDMWIHFKLIYDEEGWELRSPHYQTGDKVKASEEDNLKAAICQLHAYADEHMLTKVTDLSTYDV